METLQLYAELGFLSTTSRYPISIIIMIIMISKSKSVAVQFPPVVLLLGSLQKLHLYYLLSINNIPTYKSPKQKECSSISFECMHRNTRKCL